MAQDQKKLYLVIAAGARHEEISGILDNILGNEYKIDVKKVADIQDAISCVQEGRAAGALEHLVVATDEGLLGNLLNDEDVLKRHQGEFERNVVLILKDPPVAYQNLAIVVADVADNYAAIKQAVNWALDQ